MRKRRTVLAASIFAALSLLGRGGPVSAEDKTAIPVKEVGIRGVVARGADEGQVVIKVPFGKKLVIYEVASESPRNRELTSMVGKTVEAVGIMKKGPQGENVMVVNTFTETMALK